MVLHTGPCHIRPASSRGCCPLHRFPQAVYAMSMRQAEQCLCCSVTAPCPMTPYCESDVCFINNDGSRGVQCDGGYTENPSPPTSPPPPPPPADSAPPPLESPPPPVLPPPAVAPPLALAPEPYISPDAYGDDGYLSPLSRALPYCFSCSHLGLRPCLSPWPSLGIVLQCQLQCCHSMLQVAFLCSGTFTIWRLLCPRASIPRRLRRKVQLWRLHILRAVSERERQVPGMWHW